MWIGLAVGLALLFSLVELITKYENKLLKHIINRYLIIYLLINGCLAYGFYVCLPDIGSKMLAPDLATSVNHEGWWRSLIAGLGYPFILRSKVFNIRTGEKEVPLGLEALYLALSKYLIDNTTRIIKSVERDTVTKMIDKYHQEISTFQAALNILVIQEKDQMKKEDLRKRTDDVRKDPTSDNYEKCFALGMLILEDVGTEEGMEKLLSGIPKKPKTNN